MTNYLFRSTRWFQCCNDFLLQFLNLMGLRSPPIYLSYEHIGCGGTWCMVFWGIANLLSILTIAIQSFSIGKNFHFLDPLLDWTRWSYKLIVDLVQKLKERALPLNTLLTSYVTISCKLFLYAPNGLHALSFSFLLFSPYFVKIYCCIYRYYSMYGHVEKLAEEIKKGASSVEGVEAQLWQVRKCIRCQLSQSMLF